MRSAAIVCCVLLQPALGVADVPKQYQPALDKGLAWLAKQQRADGRWDGARGTDAELHTALAGLALMLEGSTEDQGKYAKPLTRAAGWILSRSRPDGLLGDPANKHELIAHGFAMKFLAEAYGEAESRDHRVQIRDCLARAVAYCQSHQTAHGGWSKRKGHTDLGATVAVMQGLRAARDAGIPVPRDVMKKAVAAVRLATLSTGGVAPKLDKNGLPKGDANPALTAGALAALFSAGEYKDEHCQKWLASCAAALALEKRHDAAGDPWLHFYFAPAMWRLGDDGWARMDPQAPVAQRWTWSAYRAWRFDRLIATQRPDGSWRGPVLTTTLNLIVLQQDNQPIGISR